MGILDKVFSGGISSIIDSVKGVADTFIQTKDEKAAYDLKVEEVITTRLTQMQESVRAQMNLTMEVIKAEMASGDKFTQRARPTVVYFGLLIIAWNYAVLPMLTTVGADGAITHFTPVVLPSDFWYAWGGIVSVWSAGRSAERIGVQGKVTQAVTGNKHDL